jgi:sugar phosphate isomerase/epimerase
MIAKNCWLLLLVSEVLTASCFGLRTTAAAAASLWEHDNLVAWCVVPFDAKERGPEERAQMLERLGFNHFAYDWRDKDIPTFDAEIDALQKHGIDLLAWWFPLDADNPQAKTILETFKRHHVHPQLWVVLSGGNEPKDWDAWRKLMPTNFPTPKSDEDYEKLSSADRAEIQRVAHNLDTPKNSQEQSDRVNQEATRIAALVKLAKPYGSKVELYNHNGWFGMEENQLAIIQRLKAMGVTGVGMVYNFSHARDDAHDDSKHFPALWAQIKPYVVAVNVTGMRMDGELIYPSQGDTELDMMRTIERSGWHGPIGLIAEKGGDAEITLRNYRIGLDWLAAEIRRAGAGGPRPFPLSP